MALQSAFLALSSDATARYARSLGDFTLARILADRAAPDSDDAIARHRALSEAAQRVQLEVDHPRTIADLVSDLRRRTRKSQIYEQWAADLLDAASPVAKTLPPLWRDAFMVAIDAPELRRASADAGQAVAEARAALYRDDDDFDYGAASAIGYDDTDDGDID
ncbi:hypothetical protein [Burkholderia glumae]|uniref:hypothetical protein n=1 Tax=Burkholderia glumae TaxID=337 RepID=UPI0020CE7AA7|nr:hypothetical protein [Burkholderia glumae]MCQ0031456.1 hypothetical protein [Burkholderia glumae]MCQ0035108.1 hypothetical protein [Burkholderia glumae]